MDISRRALPPVHTSVLHQKERLGHVRRSGWLSDAASLSHANAGACQACGVAQDGVACGKGEERVWKHQNRREIYTTRRLQARRARCEDEERCGVIEQISTANWTVLERSSRPHKPHGSRILFVEDALRPTSKKRRMCAKGTRVPLSTNQSAQEEGRCREAGVCVAEGTDRSSLPNPRFVSFSAALHLLCCAAGPLLAVHFHHHHGILPFPPSFITPSNEQAALLLLLLDFSLLPRIKSCDRGVSFRQSRAKHRTAFWNT